MEGNYTGGISVPPSPPFFAFSLAPLFLFTLFPGPHRRYSQGNIMRFGKFGSTLNQFFFCVVRLRMPGFRLIGSPSTFLSHSKLQLHSHLEELDHRASAAQSRHCQSTTQLRKNKGKKMYNKKKAKTTLYIQNIYKKKTRRLKKECRKLAFPSSRHGNGFDLYIYIYI